MFYNVLIPAAMFICSVDGYNAINHFLAWRQYRKTLRGVA